MSVKIDFTLIIRKVKRVKKKRGQRLPHRCPRAASEDAANVHREVNN